MSESDILIDAVRRVYDINRAVISIDPAFLAAGAMDIIGFPQSLHPVGWHGCNLHLRQVARAFCRRNFAGLPDPGVPSQPELFDTLQDRYPRRPQKDREPQYVLRAYLSEDDCWFNIDRLRDFAGGLLRHSNALQTETEERYGPRKDDAA